MTKGEVIVLYFTLVC